ncbi:MAG: hypothetical protein H6745_07445 [Deltaproteobacteria bacterium]|nr:hypothetical protein [Deltaproteobacteria bacterium]
MLDRSEIQQLLERVRAFEAPMLSLFVQSNPARAENNPRGVAIRAVNGMKHAGAPAEVVNAIRARIDNNPLPARTLAVFATQDAGAIEMIGLDVELPVDDPQEKEALAHWGEPFTAPLLMAIDEHRRAGVAYVDGDHWRFFEATPGSITELASDERDRWPIEQQGTSDRVPTNKADRGDAARDLHAAYVDDHRHRFRKDAARQIAELCDERGLSGLVVVSPNKDAHDFVPLLPKPLRDRVLGTVSAASRSDAPPDEIRRKVADLLRQSEVAREEALLDTAQERGVSGLDACLEQLQQGRVRTLLMGLRNEATVFWAQLDADTAFVATDAKKARAPFSAQNGDVTVKELPARVALPRLAERFGTRVELVDGTPRERLEDEHGGVAGLLR